jgi:hypothetical protein
MYKKKLQNEATCVRPLHLPLLTAAALCSPHFLSCTKTSHLPYFLSDPAYLQRPSLAALVIHSPRDLCLPRIYLSFVPHLLCVSLQSSSSYRHGGSITNTLATPSPFASLNYGWTRACRRSSPSLAGCSWYFLSLD